MIERHGMGGDEIADMDVVTHASAIRCRVIRTEDADAFAFPDAGLAGNLHQQGGLARGLANARPGIRTGDIEVCKEGLLFGIEKNSKEAILVKQRTVAVRTEREV